MEINTPAPVGSVWNGEGPHQLAPQYGILPDPSTGSTNYSQVLMQDTATIYPSTADAPYAAPPVATLASIVGEHAGFLAADPREAAAQVVPFII